LKGNNFKTGEIENVKENKAIHFFFAGLILIILVVTTYWGSSDNDFVDWDDYYYVVNNDLVRNPGDSYLKDLFTTPVSLNYHPLTIFSLRINNNNCTKCLNGISAKPFIRGNVTLHLLNSVLVLILMYLLTKKNILTSFLVAALFGIHPMHVESVAWIAERKDVLYTFFFLAALIAYLFFKKGNKRKYLLLAASFLLFILSCLSKATAVVFPVVMILINFWVDRTEKNESAWKAASNAVSLKNILLIIPFLIVSIFIGLIAYRIQNGENFLGMLNLSKNTSDVVNTVQPFSLLQRFQIASYGFIVYIVKFFIPVNLYAFYPYPDLKEFTSGSFAITLWFSVITIIIIALLTVYSMKRSKLYAFSLGFYFITIALVLQFISVGIAIIANRYSYLPYIGFSLIPATLIANRSGMIRKILIVLSACFLIILMYLSKQQIKTWSNTETLWTNVIEKNQHLELPRRSRGKYYYMKSSRAKSEMEKNNLESKALIDFSEAIKMGTKSSDVYEGTGIILESRGDLQNALQFLSKAISIDPKKGRAYYNRAMVHDGLNQKEEAVRDYNLALVYKPDLAIEILSNRSVLFLEAGQFKEAINDLDYLISVNPKEFMYYSNRAFAKLQLKDFNGAIADYRTVLQLKPDDQITKKQLQILLDSQNR
jgi:tetratricopeptide (TPR) repeat protein